jgi:hypothetical protein
MSPTSLVDPLPAMKKKNDKRGPLPGIWSAKDGPGPAKWRRDNSKWFPLPLSLKCSGFYVHSITNRENKLVYTARYVGKAREIRRRVVSE